MEAGRDLDKLIAEKVMDLTVVNVPEECSQYTLGARWVPGGEYYECDVWYAAPADLAAEIVEVQAAGGYDELLPLYSTAIVMAWQVVEKLRAEGYSFCVYDYHRVGIEDPDVWQAIFINASGSPARSAPTLPHAICLAALKAVE